MTWKLLRFNEDVNGNKFADGTDTFNIAPLPFRLQKRNGHFIMKDRQGGSGLSDVTYDIGELILFDAFLVPAVGLVKAGASWTDSIKGGRSSSINTYTIDKITGNIASIRYSGTYNEKADIDNRGTMTRVEKDRKCSGVIQLSLQTFLVLSKTRDGEDTITLDFMGNKQTNSSSFRMVTSFRVK
ncbi:MAG: hypothetical protein EOO88_57665 [Pedobacter sp.]|nr:MAG: hypothetical protein EOO88_57665 [Pedobacter sp.]